MFALLVLSTIIVDEFVKIPTSLVVLGTEKSIQNPRRKVTIPIFEISKTETTNQQFRSFVLHTNYVTDAERKHNSMVFEPGLPEFRWIQDKTANWRFPNGKSRDSIVGKEDHPVTGISYSDALAYCKWAKVRLPNLDEWETACRAGSKTAYFFGDDVSLITKYANIWNRKDHLKADLSDGYMTTSPVGKFAPNPLGLYDTYGNVFEFCSGRLSGDKSKEMVHARGGSWWCSRKSCCFFNSNDIGKVNIHASFSNQGFRVVKL